MLNFKNISPIADFYSKLAIKIDIVNKNVLYITHMQDKILKIVNKLENNTDLQKQVDEYFDGDEKSMDPPLEDMAQDGNSSDT